MGEDGYLPLFETKEAKGRIAFRLFSISIFVGVCLIWLYRATHVPRGGIGRWTWCGMFGAELWFGFFWILTQTVRWRPVYRYTFKERLSERYEDELPGVDIFVCTADPTIEPPMLVINTVLSLIAYDYPPNKLAIYLSDDGGSDLTFYAMLEASSFSRSWIPFCKKFKVDPRSPAAYFSEASEPHNFHYKEEWSTIKKLYEEMKGRIESVVKVGKVSEEIQVKHKGLFEWNSVLNSRNHQTILQILIDGRDPNALDDEGFVMPTLVYLSREKRPQHHHNFKAGALNALIRVSSEISNGPIILNVDCDMYSNNAASVRDALCFFMDEDKGSEIGFVQYPQRFVNITKNDIYSNSLRLLMKVELSGMDSYGGPMYIGTGCFFRRECLSGTEYCKDYKSDWKKGAQRYGMETLEELEERAKGLASSTYELATQWGKEMGMKYGCLVEDVSTGLAIHCKGWRSIYFDPPRDAFLGLAPTTLLQSLVQHKRWAEGHLQIVFSRHCSFIQGHGKMKLPHQMAYCIFNLWPFHAIPTLYYAAIPPIYLLHGIPLFPEITSPWLVPFSYVIIAKYTYSLAEHLWHGETLKAWWNDQRMWLYRKTSAYLFGTIDAILNLLGITKSAFTITVKVPDDELSKRYEQEIMEFGTTSPLFTILATLAMVNLVCLGGAIKRVVMDDGGGAVGPFVLQFAQCGLWVLINIPLYEGLFLRKDMGRMPPSLAFTSTALAVLACVMPMH
ncbi:cellulose synthase-like protein E6 [Cinnamomum micranthum f. kanehirae]|uniref:Cellulose synthase-like protein E6 n=1 Tax=Cinnamomum micranthum f. kanehirae TaxID=337451 RepID=A0A3S3PUS6_9MAGN|nr:cellulose synthase-like protein E6 [Cinnamomum micranthum f. kanehirae]